MRRKHFQEQLILARVARALILLLIAKTARSSLNARHSILRLRQPMTGPGTETIPK